MAFSIPFAFDLLCFVKKLTVIGIIGNTHGVNSAANPEKKAIINIVNKLLSDSFLGVLVTFTVSVVPLALKSIASILFSEIAALFPEI